MKIETVDQLYQLVLQHRAMNVACFNWGWGTFMLVLLTGFLVFIAFVAAADWTDHSRKKEERYQSGMLAIFFAMLAVACSFGTLHTWATYVDYAKQRAMLPSDHDLKLVGGYLVGGEVLNSEKFDKLSDAAILYLENKAKAEATDAPCSRN